MTEHTEEWRTIPGYEGIYEASSLGQIRSIARTVTAIKQGRPITQNYKGQLLKQKQTMFGYRIINVRLTSLPARQPLVHRLVAAAFLGPPPRNKPHVAHLDGDPTNNAASNLAYKSARENCDDKRRHGTHGVLTEAQALAIKTATGKPRDLKRRFNVSYATIHAIRSGRTWKHLPPAPPAHRKPKQLDLFK